MSDDEADPELLELLRQHLLGNASTVDPDADTGVLASAEYVNDNAIDVALDMRACKNAAEAIYSQMQRKHYSTATWGEHELHPTARDESTVDFVFAMDLLNFSFWTDEAGAGDSTTITTTTTTTATNAVFSASSAPPEPHRSTGFAVEHRGKTWTGYYSMVAALRRALDEGIPITSPAFWCSSKCDMALMRRVFRPAGSGDVAAWHAEAAEAKVQRNGDAGDAAEVAGGSGDATDAAAGSAGSVGVSSGLASEENGPEKEEEAVPSASGKPEEDAAGVSQDAEDGDARGEAQKKGTEDSANDNVGGVEKNAEDLSDSAADAKAATDGTTDTKEPVSSSSSCCKTVSVTGPTPSASARTPTPDDGPSSSLPEMPLLAERLACLKEAGQVLDARFGGRAVNVLNAAGGSAAKLVNILAREFACFRDECPFPNTSSKAGGGGGGSDNDVDDDDDDSYGFGRPRRRRRRTVRFLKRAQILAAELWACFQGTGYGAFGDIDKLTMFADYRVPQILQALGCLYYSPPLLAAIQAKRLLPSGGSWEVQLRGCTIWCVELLRREIKNKHPDAEVNAVLIDFFLYDTMKEMEAAGKDTLPHHRTRSIWY